MVSVKVCTSSNRAPDTGGRRERTPLGLNAKNQRSEKKKKAGIELKTPPNRIGKRQRRVFIRYQGR